VRILSNKEARAAFPASSEDNGQGAEMMADLIFKDINHKANG